MPRPLQWRRNITPREPATVPVRPLVCVVGLRGLPGIMGGIEAHCEELLPRIAAQAPNLEIEVIARRPYQPEATTLGSVRVTPLYSTRSRSTEALTGTLAGVIYAKRRGARLLHIHAVGPGLLAPLARALGMRVVFTHHGADYRRLKWGLVARTILRLGEQLAVRCSHATIAVAPSLAADLRSRYPAAASRISYIPNGTPSCGPGDCAKLLAELAVRPKDFILTVGRLVPEKAFDLLVEAHRRSGTRRKLVVVGAADHESEFSRALMKKASDDVIFTGALPREIVHALYAQAALFVLPSFHEGLPIAALEAGSAGCPMLLSDIEPHRDLALPPENYFAAGDTGALSECLKSDPARFQVDKEAFRAFDWDQIAPATLSVYEATLRG